MAIHRLGLPYGLHEDRQSLHVIVQFRTVRSGRQPVHDDACFTRTCEGGSSPHPNGRAASQQNLLKRQRAMVVVGQVRAGSRSSSGLEQLLASVTAVVDLDVARERFAQVLK